MRRVKVGGFAGLPGVVLSRDDVGRLASYMAEEERRASTAAVGLSGASTTSVEKCDTCAPSPLAGLADKVAARVFREMGAAPLADAAVNGKRGELLERAGMVAAGMAEALKFQKDTVATLEGMTSPMFAKAVARSAKKLHGLPEGERIKAALVFCYLTGVADDHGKRNTIYSDGYRKSVNALAGAIGRVGDPAQRETARSILAALGRQPSAGLSGLGRTWGGPVNTAPASVVRPLFAANDPTFGVMSRQVAWQDEQRRLTEDPAVAARVARDIGTATRSPASVKVVDTFSTIASLWAMLVGPVQTTVAAWKKTAKPFGNDRVAAIASAKSLAAQVLKAKSDGRFDEFVRSKNITRDPLLASWIVANYGDRITAYANPGIGSAEWERYGDIDVTVREMPRYDFEPSSGFAKSEKNTGKDYSGTVGSQIKRVGLYAVKDGSYIGVASHGFALQCMVAYYAGTEQTRAHLLEYLARPTTQFPVVVGYALALARRDALERTGQIGNYVGAEWVPDANGIEQTPQETAAYADWFNDAGPNGNKPRWSAINFVARVYRQAYQKEPTRHALGWYGRMGFGLGEKWHDLAPNDLAAYEGAIIRRRRSDIGVRTVDDERLAGADLPADTAADRSNWFIVFGNKVGGALSVVLDVMSKGLEYATKILCSVFKWMFGETVGGVVCSIINAVLKFMVGLQEGAIASAFAIVKALSLFIGELAKGEIMRAFKALFLGVNQAIFFAIGGPFAGLIGGDRMPFLKSQEADARAKAKAAGFNPDDVVLPSLERMAEEMTSENPFFIFDVAFAVIEIATTAGAALLKASGRLVYALCPVVGFILGPNVAKSIRESKNPDINQWKRLTVEQVRKAITAITKIIAAVVMGVIAVAQAIKMIGEPWKRYVAKKGGTGKAIWAATGYAAKAASNELTVVFATFLVAAKRGFKGDDPAMIQLKDALWSLAKKAPEIIIGFCVEELGASEAEAVKTYQQAAVMVYDSVEEAKRAYKELQEILYPATEYEVTPEPLPKDKSKAPPKEEGGKMVLPVLALAAGLAIGIMFSGGSDGA